MKRVLSFITALTVLTGIFTAVTPYEAKAASLYAESFEEEESLQKWQTINGGSIEISDERQKLDSKSLKWTYETGGILRLIGCDGFGQFKSFRAGNGVKLWIYSTNRTDADMTVKIGKASSINDAPSYEFKVHMDFEGWRCIWARVNEFAKTGHSNDGADSLQLEMPADMGEGVLYIDAFDVNEGVNYTACADAQLPYLPITYTGYQYAAYTKIPETISEKQCLPEHKRAFKTIAERLDNYILPQGIDYQSLDAKDPVKIRYDAFVKGITSAVKRYDSYNIKRREDGSMEGPGLTAVADNVGVQANKFEQIWVALALDWKLNKNEESLRKIMDLFDWSYEQGWAEGSAMGAMRFTEIRLVGYVFAVYMLRDELSETGRLERELANLRWRSELGCIFAYDDPEIAQYSSVDVDKMRSVALFQLIYILSMEDSPEKVSYMKQYSEYLQNVILPRTGTDGGIKNDYTLWHHYSAFMSNYGAEAISVLCQLKYFLSGTYFDINNEATKTLYKTLEVYRASSNKLDLPLRVRGRYPESNNTMITIAPAYVFLAASGSREAAEIFLDIWDENSAEVQASYKTAMPSITWLTTLGQPVLFDEVRKAALAKGYTAAAPMSGSYIFPYGGYAVFRRDNWMAAVSGFSSYIWDYEGSTTENFYGRYMNYGSTTVISEDGFVPDGIDVTKGWNWSRWPGVTAKNMPNKELEVKGNARNYSDETFLGGVAAEAGAGIYAMKLHDTSYDTTFRANKSWFFFGDRLICLGSDISNSDMDHNTETTLFQNVMGDDTAVQINVDGEAVSEFPYENCIKENKTVYLTDIDGNGYIIPDAAGLTVERKPNESVMHNGIKSLGNTTAAYINHGAAPRNSGYEYVILPQKGAEATALAAENPGYDVLKKDSSAHVVKDSETGAIGYVFFGTDSELDFGAVKSVSRPCVIMEATENDELTLNFQDPDLRVVVSGTVEQLLTKSELRTAKVVLEGLWEMKEENPDVRVIARGSDTTLEFDGMDGRQTDVVLVRVK